MASYSIEVDAAALRLVEDMRSLTTDVLEITAGFAISEILDNIPHCHSRVRRSLSVQSSAGM